MNGWSRELWEEYKHLHYIYTKKNYPHVPDNYIATPSKTNINKANGLTRTIINWIIWSGGHAERVNVTGRKIKNKNGKEIWIKTSGALGSADIHATINGTPVYIEIKIGKDKMSERQVKYAERVQRSGAIYLVVKKLEDFISEFKNIQNDIEQSWK